VYLMGIDPEPLGDLGRVDWGVFFIREPLDTRISLGAPEPFVASLGVMATKG
jgi:hypothetical protein